MRSTLIALFAIAMGVSTSFAQMQHRPLLSDIPEEPAKSSVMILYQCEKDQCMRGMGGLWVLQGDKGEGIWPYGDSADLTVTSRDGNHIVIERMDRPGSSSDQWADPAVHHFHAKYEGTLVGGTFRGRVEYNGVPQVNDRWSADIGKSPVCDDTRCQANTLLVRQLGFNLFDAKLWDAAIECARTADAHGDVEAAAMLGSMTFKGLGVKADRQGGFAKLAAAAKAGSYIGQYSLGKAYEHGLDGVNKSPEQAEYWTRRAEETQRTMIAQAQAANNVQLQRSARQDAAAGLIMLFLGAMSGGNAGFDGNNGSGFGTEFDQMRQNRESGCSLGDQLDCQSVGMKPPNQ